MKSPVYIPNDVLFDVFKLCDRFAINERFEFVNARWSNFVAVNEAKHFPKFKMDKLWICPLFCSLQYSLKNCEQQTTNGEIFTKCTEKCKKFYSKFISDEWPAQRIPFCIYIQRFANDTKTLKKITLNNCVWKIERSECAHFFWHFKDLCFGQMAIDIFNDRAVTLFLIDCPLFKPNAEQFEIRTSTEPWAFMRAVELTKQKITIKNGKKYLAEKGRRNENMLKKLSEIENPVAKFILSGRQFCTEIVVEAHQFALLFELIEEYKCAPTLQHAIQIVRLFVPSFAWHRREFVEGTLSQMFHSSQKLSPLVHKFGHFEELSSQEKFICLVRFSQNEKDKIDHYEFQIKSNSN